MRAGRVSAAALAARSTTPTVRTLPRHCPETEYVSFVRGQDIHPGYRNQKLRHYRRFMQAWPTLDAWFDAPLVERVGRLPGENHKAPSNPVSFFARPYLLFLAGRGYATYDYPFLLGAGQIRVIDHFADLGADLGAETLVEEAVALGFDRGSAHQAVHWSVSRIALHTGERHVDAIIEDHIASIAARSPPSHARRCRLGRARPGAGADG